MIMTRTAVVLCLLSASFAFGVVPSPSRADNEVEMSLPLFREPTHRVASVNREEKTAVVMLQPQTPMFVSASEGLGVLLLSSSGRAPFDTLVRVDVQEIQEGGKLLVAFGEGATTAMRKGPAVLWRPFAGEFGQDNGMVPATTQQLRALPDLLSANTTQATAGLLEAVLAARAAARRTSSMNNLKQIGLAFHNYAEVHRHFPPAVIYGPDGKPWHSWRVLLLPFLEQIALYEQYDFSQPWDAPANKQVSDTILQVYRDPAVDRDGALTDYAAIVGEDAIFKPNFVTMKSPDDFPECLTRNRMQFRDVTDGTSNTIMFATVASERQIPWAKPEDIVLDENFPGVGKPAGIGAVHPGASPDTQVALVGFADGSVRTVRGDLESEKIAPFLTRNGAEVVEYEVLDAEGGNVGGGAPQPMIRIFKSDDGTYGLSVD